MVRQTAKLSNCYVPLPVSASRGALRKDKKELLATRDSGDGQTTRSEHSLRRLLLQSNVIESAAGSALVEIGHTKVICQVIGPITSASKDMPPNLLLNMEEGVLHCQVRYAPHIGYPTAALVNNSVSTMDQSNQLLSSGKVTSWTITRETDLASRLSDSLAAAVPVKQYPKCAILVQVTVLQDDGSILPACITAASIALAGAAIEIYDLVTASTVAVVQDRPLADPTLEEIEVADAVVTLALMPNWKEVTLWEQSGGLSPEQANRAMELCRDGCRTMHRFLREHLIQEHEPKDEGAQDL